MLNLLVPNTFYIFILFFNMTLTSHYVPRDKTAERPSQHKKNCLDGALLVLCHVMTVLLVKKI
jgi:hypothetical protein